MRAPLLLGLLAAASLSHATMPTLTPGMQAPKLDVAGWLRYDAPVPQKGHYRVVEFWATWCGPCKQSIPHLTELAHKYKDKIDFVGVSVWEHPGTTTADLQKFVKDFGDKMDYRVAYDKDDKTMANTWMKAAGQNGIPASFLIDDTGEILWVGHPMELEKPIEEVLVGKFDRAAAKAAFMAEAKAADEMDQARTEVVGAAKLYKDGKKTEAETTWDAQAKKGPEIARLVQNVRLATYPAGSPESTTLVDKMIAGSPEDQMMVTQIAIRRAMAKEPGSAESARSIADRIAAKTKDPINLYYCAVVYSRLDAYAEVVKTADAGLASLETDPRKNDLPGLKEALTKVREEAVAKTSKN